MTSALCVPSTWFPRKRESNLIWIVDASHFGKRAKASTAPADQRVTFLTSGILPSAPSGPAALFAPLLRRSAGAKKVTKETPFRI
jgi:hypothetical protein